MPIIYKTLWLVKKEEVVVVVGGGGGGGQNIMALIKCPPGPPSPSLALQNQRCFLSCPVCMFDIVIS